MVPGQEASSNNLGDEAILMSSHTILFHDKIRKFP